VIASFASSDVFEHWNLLLGGVRCRDAAGVYRPGTNVLVLRDDPDPRISQDRLEHELVHHLVTERGWALPGMFEEGVAMVLAAGEPRGTRLVGLDMPDPARIQLARRLALEDRLHDPVAVLLEEDSGDGVQALWSYAQAWSAVAMLARRGDDVLRSTLVRIGSEPGLPPEHHVRQRALLEPLVDAVAVRGFLTAP
jgi:hypothetical protein